MASTSTAVSVDRKDPRFDTLKKGHNLRFPATEAEAVSRILLCGNADEAAEALQRVVAAGLRPTVRSGGHCYEDFVSNNPNGAILDLSLHRAVEREADGGFYVASGAVLGDVYQMLYKRGGVTLPAGTCYMVGAGGHISGGGYGLLSRMQGLTVDWITAVDILTVNQSGKVVPIRATRDSHADLFRACRGAGNGNFGLITGFHFAQLPTAPREVAEVSLHFPWAEMTEAKFTKLLQVFGSWCAGRGQERETWGLFADLVMGPRSVKGEGYLGLHAQFCTLAGDTSDLSVLHEFLGQFKEFVPTVILPAKLPSGNSSTTSGQQDIAAETAKHFYQVSRLPWLDATLADGGSGGGTRAKYKSAYMKETFTAAECAAMWRFMTTESMDAHGSVLAIDSYGGAINKPGRAGETAIAQRASVMKLQWQCYWREKEQDAGRLKFMDEFYTAVYTGDHVETRHQGTPWGPGYEGCYMNYPDADMLRYIFWPQLYFGRGDLYSFLTGVKAKYDPNNIFHNAMSVRPGLV